MYSVDDRELYANSFKRSVASMIDMIIVLMLRCITLEILGRVWADKVITKFLIDFKTEFGTDQISNSKSHLDFIMHHQVFSVMLKLYFIIIMVGALYHAFLNSSKWQATVGKRLMRLVIVDLDDYGEVTFLRSLVHYFLSVLPMAYVLYLLIFQTTHDITFFQAIIATKYNIFFGIIFTAWLQAHFFTEKRATAYDLILNTAVINGETRFRLPYSKGPRITARIHGKKFF